MMSQLREIRIWIHRAWSLLLCTWIVVPLSFAQIVYQCDFEDEAERSQWKMNEGPRADLCPNNWFIGQTVNATRDGSYGLFVSESSNGQTATYSGAYNCIAVAVRELDLAEGDYTVFFDWMAKGKAASTEGIWLCWVPDTVETFSARTLRPLWVDKYRIDTVFNSSSMWKQGNTTFHTDGGKHKFAIVWTNTTGSYTVPPSGCVDNIIIIPKEDECPPPTDFTRSMIGTTMRISWKGEADWYDARVYDYGAQEWHYFDSITLKRIEIDGLSEGMAQVFVRSHCGKEGISGYVLYTPFYFLPGRCINYLAIDDPTQCATYIGTADQPMRQQMLVDSGYASINSRHTLHYIPDETDPRTDNMLRTKPEGALASVRLGNWNIGAEGEAIGYTYEVPDGDVAILKLKYAIVLNQPSTPHEESVQSSFQLNIFYMEPGKTRLIPLPGGCGAAHFHVGYGDQTGWHAVGNGETMYKEWTEVAVNLREYVGKRIVVQLSTADCTAGGHYSYAYFTLDCESGELSGLNCGEDNPTTSFTAPSGFDYAWYLPDNPSNILSTEQVFTIQPMDTLLYNVDVISKTNTQCYYTLDACGIPRYPVAKADYKWNGGEHCQNIVTFYNQSYIYYKNIERWNQDHRSDTVYTNNEKVQETIWDFGDGEVVMSNADSIVHVYPAQGGKFSPTITVSISDGACSVQKPIIDQLELPDVSVEEKEKHLSKGSMYNGKVYWEPMVIDDIVIEDGCETLYHIYIHETEFTVDTSICEGGYFPLGDQRYTETGTYKGKLKSLQWPEVDSIVTLNLQVEPALVIQTADTFVVCADAQFADILVTKKQGSLDSVYIRFNDPAARSYFRPIYAFGGEEKIELEIPKTIRADYYHAVLQAGSARCPAPEKEIVIQVNYPGSVLMQQYGFIAMLDTMYNGGYSFTEYRWYRNGELLPNQNKSYIIVDPDEDMYAEFVVVPTRTDGVVLPVCPVIYTGAMAIEDVPVNASVNVHPRIVPAGGVLTIESDSKWMMVDVLGRTVLPLNDASKTQVPSQAGVYIMVFPYAHETVRIIVR